jgi:GNAT superfamily N-acetyltransferase
MTVDLELMRIEIDTLWVRDARGRLLRDAEPAGRPAPHLVIAVASDGQEIAIGGAVPDNVAREVSAIANASTSRDPSVAPDSLSDCISVLRDAVGAVEVRSGPSYIIERPLTQSSDATIRCSSDGDASDLRRANPANWTADDWERLIGGALGPWAMAMDGGRVASICHCARLTRDGTEAGVWTDPDYRGRGYAAAVTAAWSSLMAPTGRRMFYSTAASNRSSQRVAARLGLRCIGWMWQLRSREGEA